MAGYGCGRAGAVFYHHLFFLDSRPVFDYYKVKINWEKVT
jgi:hypothetical protein